MATLFTKIIQRQIPAHIVAEDAHNLAFLDIRPLMKGHTLVIPKREVDYYFDVPDEELTRLTLFSKKIAIALKQAISCTRIGVAVVGLEVPHAHVHLVPLNNEGDISFTKKRLEVTHDDLKQTVELIKPYL